ncbi:MAG TPA: hypothetical protein VMF14_16115 [Solirubrobacteraceae bacterium]|nr:hypothetical protein [Solirubrobacteraceae bacterium]
MPGAVTPHPHALALQDLHDASRWDAADPDVVAATAMRVAVGDGDAWLREWTQAGGAAWAEAKRTGDPALYRHAASYYAAALAAIADSDGSVDETQLWHRQRECWDRASSLDGGRAAPVPYEGADLPGYFFSGGPGRRPLVIIDHGGRAPTSQAWALAGAAAHRRGFHWMTFDGPGRQPALCRDDLALRPDWEAVLTPVVDAMIARADVDPERMAVVGSDLAGYAVARALAYEHRFVAGAVVPGIVDLSRPWLDGLPAGAHEALRDGDRGAFERELHLADLFVPGSSARLRRAARSFGPPGTGLYELYRTMGAFRLGDEVSQIATPLLVCARAQALWPEQSRELWERLPTPSELRRHATGPEIIDWLGEHF